MGRALKHDIPGSDWRVAPEEISERGLEAIYPAPFPRPLRLVVDLGFGRGEFVMALAEKAPTTPFLAVEYSPKRVLKMARRLARTELENVRLVHGRSEVVVGEHLPDACVECFWINFPDPWPKKRHHAKRRLDPTRIRPAACWPESLVAGRAAWRSPRTTEAYARVGSTRCSAAETQALRKLPRAGRVAQRAAHDRSQGHRLRARVARPGAQFSLFFVSPRRRTSARRSAACRGRC